MKAAIIVALTVALGVLAFGQSRQMHTPGTDIGRFQIVNGTPEMARNIMLLDTITGESWISCNGADGTTEWCLLPRLTSGATGKP